MARSFKPCASGIVAVLCTVLATSGMALAAVTAFNVDHKSVASTDHSLDTVTGEITCTVGDTAFVPVNLAQGKSGNFGFGSVILTCTGSSQLWSVSVPVIFPTGGHYDNGPATVFSDGLDATDGSEVFITVGIVIT